MGRRGRMPPPPTDLGVFRPFHINRSLSYDWENTKFKFTTKKEIDFEVNTDLYLSVTNKA